MPFSTLAYYGESGEGTPERLNSAGGEPETGAWPIRPTGSVSDGPREKLVEVLVHEFGHAASTPDDVEVRSGLGREWASIGSPGECRATALWSATVWCADDNEPGTGRFDNEHPRRVTDAGSRRTIGQSVDVGRGGGHRLPMTAV